MRSLPFAIGAVALLPLLSVLADPPKHEKASDQPPKHEKEVEAPGTIPLHFHPDGVHRMYVLEGKLKCTVGKEAMEMGPGDYMLIPKGVRHKFEKAGEGKAYFVTVDTPPINPANNVWLEPAPKSSDKK